MPAKKNDHAKTLAQATTEQVQRRVDEIRHRMANGMTHEAAFAEVMAGSTFGPATRAIVRELSLAHHAMRVDLPNAAVHAQVSTAHTNAGVWLEYKGARYWIGGKPTENELKIARALFAAGVAHADEELAKLRAELGWIAENRQDEEERRGRADDMGR